VQLHGEGAAVQSAVVAQEDERGGTLYPEVLQRYVAPRVVAQRELVQWGHVKRA
jgi:hypothetical protein